MSPEFTSQILGVGPTTLLAEEGGFNPLQVGDLSLFFWTLIVFVILLVILGKFVWKPLMKTIDERESKVRDDLSRAEAARTEAEAARQAHLKDIEQASAKVKAMLDDAHLRAERLKTELETEARSEAAAILSKAYRQIEAEKAQALQQIRDQVVELSIAISRRVLEREVGHEDHLREAELLLPRVREIV